MQAIDALFIAYYKNNDIYMNEEHSNLSRILSSKGDGPKFTVDRTKGEVLDASCIHIDDGPYDFARMLSIAKYSTPTRHREFDAHTTTHLVGPYLYSLLKRNNFSVHSVNYCDRLDLESLGTNYLPRHILVSTSMIDDFLLTDLCRRIRQIWPDACLVLGGLLLVELEKSLESMEFIGLLEDWNADAYVCTPRGEESVLKIVASGKDKLFQAKPPMTWLRTDSGYVKTDTDESLEITIDAECVRWSLLPPESLYHCIHLRTSRSCSFQCIFCTYPANQGALALGSIQSLEQQFSELSDIGHVKSLVFIDDTFNVPKDRFQDICRLLGRYGFEWYSHFRVQHCDADTAKLMEDSGCRGVFLGIESVDNTVLSNMKKDCTVEEYVRGLRHLANTQIFTHASILVGFPGDRADNIHKTATFLDEHGLDTFAATPWRCSPATPVSDQRFHFQISGRFNRWSHATMDAKEASELCEVLRKLPQKCVYADEITAEGFWSSLLLLSNGISRHDVCRVWRSYGKLMGKRMSRREIEASVDYKNLVSIMGKYQFTPVQ